RRLMIVSASSMARRVAGSLPARACASGSKVARHGWGVGGGGGGGRAGGGRLPARACPSASKVASHAWVLAVASVRVKPWVVPSSRRSLAWGRSREAGWTQELASREG